MFYPYAFILLSAEQPTGQPNKDLLRAIFIKTSRILMLFLSESFVSARLVVSGLSMV
jgi:hypothetical protein